MNSLNTNLSLFNWDIWALIATKLDDRTLAIVANTSSKNFYDLFRKNILTDSFLQKRFHEKTGMDFKGRGSNDYFSQIFQKNVKIHRQTVHQEGINFEAIGRFFKNLFFREESILSPLYPYKNRLFVQNKIGDKFSFQTYNRTPSTCTSNDLIAYCDKNLMICVEDISKQASKTLATLQLKKIPTQMALTSNCILWGDDSELWRWNFLSEEEPKPFFESQPKGVRESVKRKFILDSHLLFVIDKDTVDVYEDGRKTHDKVLLEGSSVSSLRLWKGEYLFYLEEGGIPRCQNLLGSKVDLPALRDIEKYFLFDEKIYLVNSFGDCYLSFIGDTRVTVEPILTKVTSILYIQKGNLVMIREPRIDECFLTYFNPVKKEIVHEEPMRSYKSVYCDPNVVLVTEANRLTAYLAIPIRI